MSAQEEHPAERSERVIDGLGVAPGIAIGPAFLYARDGYDDVERLEIPAEAVEDEVKRFERAVVRSEGDLDKISSIARDKLGPDSASIFEAQLLMLRDEALYNAVIERIRTNCTNADHAVQTVMTKHRRLMENSDSEYLRERSNDLLDVEQRIIRHLRRGKILSAIDPKTIVIAQNLTAADIILFSRRSVLGCATDHGGATSHVSIMARALGVPAVVGTHGVTDEVAPGDTVILDGVDGQLILNPRPETLRSYRARQRRYDRQVREQREVVPLPAETADGHRVALRANLEFEEELPLLKEYGAEGIGLFRTEILFLMKQRASFSEEEQYATYRRIVETTAPELTTFRVLDLGGDKMLPMAHREHNPVLGWRGIRILLDKPEELLYPQLRAMLRAGAHGPVRILLPMISSLEELRAFREHFVRAEERLADEGVEFARDVPVGIMVEVPSVALMAPHFAQEVDFLSLGTNDLTQYTLAIDRANDLVADRYDEMHPAVLSLIARTARAARDAGIPVSVCGEMGANPRATALLLGMGITELTASPTYLPEVKRVLRATTMEEAAALSERALQASSATDVHAIVNEWSKKKADELPECFGVSLRSSSGE